MNQPMDYRPSFGRRATFQPSSTVWFRLQIRRVSSSLGEATDDSGNDSPVNGQELEVKPSWSGLETLVKEAMGFPNMLSISLQRFPPSGPQEVNAMVRIVASADAAGLVSSARQPLHDSIRIFMNTEMKDSVMAHNGQLIDEDITVGRPLQSFSEDWQDSILTQGPCKNDGQCPSGTQCWRPWSTGVDGFSPPVHLQVGGLGFKGQCLLTHGQTCEAADAILRDDIDTLGDAFKEMHPSNTVAEYAIRVPGPCGYKDAGAHAGLKMMCVEVPWSGSQYLGGAIRSGVWGRCEVWTGLQSLVVAKAQRCLAENIVPAEITPQVSMEAERAAYQDDGCGFDDEGRKQLYCREAPPVMQRGGDQRGVCLPF